MGEVYILRHRWCNYPWPYCDEGFAPWKETDDSLITDPANFVIRRSTSYCAWKIRQVTGKWPTKRERARYDAKDWSEFLELNGFRKVEASAYLDADRYYIGVAPEIGEFGQLYWFIHYHPHKVGWHREYACRTYADFKPVVELISANDSRVTWYEIGRRIANIKRA